MTTYKITYKEETNLRTVGKLTEDNNDRKGYEKNKLQEKILENLPEEYEYYNETIYRELHEEAPYMYPWEPYSGEGIYDNSEDIPRLIWKPGDNILITEDLVIGIWELNEPIK